jgi:hypothetical protein
MKGLTRLGSGVYSFEVFAMVHFQISPRLMFQSYILENSLVIFGVIICSSLSLMATNIVEIDKLIFFKLSPMFGLRAYPTTS